MSLTLRRCFAAACLVLLGTGSVFAAAGLTADQILARYAKARGGAEAWQAVKSMAWTGRIESMPESATPATPFMMMFRRPNATRFEVIAQGRRSVRIFNGEKGWKLRPTGQGLPDISDYSNEEVGSARDAAELDGPLIDSRTKGVAVETQGDDQVEGRKAYRLKVTLPTGQVQFHWIDAETFLDIRYDRLTQDAKGRRHTTSVFYRNYKTVQGLVIPMSIETGSATGQGGSRMVIERIALNPALGDDAFRDPAERTPQHHGVIVKATPDPPVADPAK